MSTGSTLHGSLRSSMRVARHPAVCSNISLSIFCFVGARLGLINFAFFSSAYINLCALHSIPSMIAYFSSPCAFKNAANSSLSSFSTGAEESAALPREVGASLAGMASLISAVMD